MASKKSLIVAGIVTSSLGLTAAMVPNMASAAETSDGSSKASIVDKIATKFNLNKDQVQQVFDQDRQEHEADRKAKLEERLTQAVSDGKITADQKQAILTKLDELQKQREANKDKFKDMTAAERKAAMEQERTDLQTWAKQNNIPMEYLMMGGPGHDHGMGMGTPANDGDQDAPASQQS